MSENESRECSVMVVGAGAGGIAVANDLQNGIGIENVVVLDCFGRAGDVWRTRYEGITMHEPATEYCLPSCPKTPKRLREQRNLRITKDELADYLEECSTGLDIRFRRKVVLCQGNPEQGWIVHARVLDDTGNEIASEEEEVYRCKHLVLARGRWGAANKPQWAPEWSVHSSELDSAARFKDKRLVIVGYGTSGAELAEFALKEGATSVKVVQRSAVGAIPIEAYFAHHHHRSTMSKFNKVARTMTQAVAPSLCDTTLSKTQQYLTDMTYNFYSRRNWGSGWRARLKEKNLDVRPYAKAWAETKAHPCVLHKESLELVLDGSIEIVRDEVVATRDHTVILKSGKELETDELLIATGFSPAPMIPGSEAAYSFDGGGRISGLIMQASQTANSISEKLGVKLPKDRPPPKQAVDFGC